MNEQLKTSPCRKTAVMSVVVGLLAWALQPAEAAVPIPERLTLSEALSLLENNPALQVEIAQIDAEKGDVEDAGRYSNPTLSFGSEGWVLDSDEGSFVKRMQPSVSLRQEILTGGKREKRTRLEEADTEIASILVDDLRRRLRFEVKDAYFRVVLAQRDLELARRILEQFREIVQLNRVRFDAGEISGAELRRTEAAEYPFFAAAVDAEVRLKGAKADLLALLGSGTLDQNLEVVDDFNPDFSPPGEEELREMALRQRPDLAAERARVRRADAAIELEKARSRPNLTAFAGYQRELDTSGPIVGLELPLFLFNRNEGQIHRTQAERRRQENRLHYERLAVLKEVRISLDGLEGVRRRIEALEGGYLDKARQARDITESSYRLGEASLIEFLDAERTYSETVLLYNQALFEFAVSRARLERAVGEDF